MGGLQPSTLAYNISPPRVPVCGAIDTESFVPAAAPIVSAERTIAVTPTQCASAAQRISMTYRTANGTATEREVDPYGVGYLYGAWYVVGYCHQRRDLRSFRLDRVHAVHALPKTFGMPKQFDMLKHLRESIAAIGRTHAIAVILYTDLAAAQRAIPSSLGKLTKQADGIRLDAQADDLNWFARELSRLELAFRIIKPKALNTALAAHLRRLLATQG